MNFAFFAARKYFLSPKKRNFINVISMIAMTGAAVGTAALVIVLSVLNGYEDLLKSLYSSFDPEIKVSVSLGKSFEVNDDFRQQLSKTEGVLTFTEVIEDNALVKYADVQTLVRIKGVGNNYHHQSNIKKVIKKGSYVLQENEIQYAVFGTSLQQILSINLENDFYVMQIWYPKKQNASSINPANAFNKGTLKPGGVFEIEQEYDEKYLLAPLDFTASLMDYENRRTSIEIKTKPEYSVDQVIDNLTKVLGYKFKIEDREKQHASLYRAIKIEKLFCFITFSFILGIASLNIFFALTMLGIEKKKDISVLYSMGATKNLIRKIFLYEGAIISSVGAFLGLAFGIGICLIQQEFGIVSMGMQTSIVQAYPVQIQTLDIVFIGVSIVLITVLVSFSPARKASNVNLKTNL